MESLTSDTQYSLKLGRHTLIAGVLLAILGTIGLIMPGVISIATVVLVSWMLVFAGALWSYQTWLSRRGAFFDWLKPVLLIVTGGLMLFYPLSGVAAVGLLLAVYLLLDAFGSFTLATAIRPNKGWGWMTFNGIISLILAILFLLGWPASSLFLVGLYVAISLVFDGWALIVIGWAVRKARI